MKAQYLYEKLLSTGIIGAQGEVIFKLNGVETIIHDSSIIGNVIQEWLKKFMLDNDIYFRTIQNTQDFPDFLMGENDTTDLLEVKCFKSSPNFDVANFMAYSRSLLEKPYRLDADYLIFEYIEVHGGIIIKNIWLKKVWQICSASERSPIKIQWKQGIPVNIRPATWYSSRISYPVFNSRLEFVNAIKKVLDVSSISNNVQKNWLANVSSLYLQQTGRNL